MKRVLYTTLLVTAMSMTTPAKAFDLGGLVTNAVKDAIKEEVTETTKDVTKEAAKSAASAAGIEGADKVIDYAADNANGIQNGATNLGAAKNMMGGSGIGEISGTLSGAAIAADQARILNNGATPADKYKQEYIAISNKMGNCGADNACITKYQQQLIALQKRGDAYVAKTGDANYDGKTDSVDGQVSAVIKKATAAQKAARTRPSSGGYND